MAGLGFTVADASGIVVADCRDAEDAALVVGRWGWGSTVTISVGRKRVTIYTEQDTEPLRAQAIQRAADQEHGAYAVRRSWARA